MKAATQIRLHSRTIFSTSLRAAAFVAAFACLLVTEASAQWLNYPTPGIPRTPVGHLDRAGRRRL
jgi:hypothetical protein